MIEREEEEEPEEKRREKTYYIILIESYKITLFLYAFAYNQTDTYTDTHTFNILVVYVSRCRIFFLAFLKSFYFFYSLPCSNICLTPFKWMHSECIRSRFEAEAEGRTLYKMNNKTSNNNNPKKGNHIQ